MAGQSARQWNIFVRELVIVLGKYGMTLSSFYDRTIVPYPEKVRRLQQSLDRPASFPTLNPEELDRLIKALDLTSTEQNQLKAAIIATAAERILMDRVDPDTALRAADEVFHIIFDDMEGRPNSGLDGIKGDALFVEPEIADDPDFDAALDLIDRATLALHASVHAVTPRVRVTKAREAEATYATAVALLEPNAPPTDTLVTVVTVATPVNESDEKRLWLAEARNGRSRAQALMRPQEGDHR